MFSKTLKQTRIKQINVSKPFGVFPVQARFCYPNVIIFEDNKNIRIVNVLNKDQGSSSNKLFCFEKDIKGFIVHNQILWLALDSSELIVIDVIKGLQLKIIINNYANYKIRHFVTDGKNLFLISESGERLAAPFNTENLTLKLDNGVTEQFVTLEKSSMSFTYFSEKECAVINGFNMFLNEERDIGIRCPVTGVIDFMSTNNDVEFIVPWGDMAVMGSKFKMSILNFKEYNTAYDFENIEFYYYPLEAYNNVFYFLLWSTEEVHICCALSSQCEDQLEFDNSMGTTPTLTTQESLKSQLKVKVEEAIQTVNPQVELMTQLQTLFSNICDYTFLITMAIELCKSNLTYKSVLFQIQKQVFATEDDHIMKLFSDVMIKIDLLEYICFRGISYYDVNLFDLNFIELCVTFISKSDLDLASICWLKYSEIKLAVSVDDIVNTLNAIPLNIKMGGLIVWLRNFIPPVLQENPFHIDLFVKWTKDRVFLLEQSTYWPKIGLKFIEAIANVLERSLKTISLRPISIDDLDVLKDHINYIMELKDKHKVNMLLSELSSQSPTEVALVMLRRCYTEDLEVFLQSSLPSYAARYQFELDYTLRSFVESEATSSRGCVDGHRLQILLNAFRSPTNKLECLLQVLKVLEVPWSDTVLNIATEAAASASTDFTVTDADRTIAQEIYIELNYARMKVILKKYNFPLSFNNYILVIHKIVNASTVDLNDLKVITTVVGAYSHYAHLMYIDKCLQNCDTDIALDYFNNLPNNDRKVLLRAIVNKYDLIINRKVKEPITERNYLDLLKGTKSVDDKLITELENLYYLKNSYNITLTLNDICTEKVRHEVASKWEQQDATTASSGSGRHLNQLLRRNLSNNSNLLTLLYKVSSQSKVRNFVERFILFNPKKPDNYSVLLDFKDGNNSEILLDACDVLSQLVFSCNEEHLHYLIERLAILNSLVNSNITMTNLSVVWKFHYLYLPMSSVPALNDLIDFYIDTAKCKEIDLANISIKSDFLPIRMIGHIMSHVIGHNHKLSDDFLKLRNKICKKLLTKVVVAQEFDHLLVTSLLLTICDETMDDYSWILDILRGQSDSISPVALHYLSSPLIRHTFELNSFVPGSNMSYPPQYILKSKFNINLAEIALPENTEETWDVKILLFYILRQFPNTSFERLEDLCDTLNVSLNDGLSLLLISILSSWNLEYKIYSNNLGRKQLLLNNDEHELLSKCLIVWDSIKVKDFIKDILSDFWKNGEVTLHGCLVSINPYYYEVYLCIYCLIFSSNTESRKTKEYLLLNFLKNYKRKGTPRQYEFELFSVKGMFPELGHYRLPFHLFIRDDMWSNLKSEITLETYEYWLPVVPLLSLDSDLQIAKDMICSNAVKQTMTSRKQDSTEVDPKEREPWRLMSREEPLLRTAHRCVKHIANMEWAGACLFYVLQGCARGADQVAAAQLCYQFSQRWAAVQPGNRAVQQMERLHSSLSTRHALHKIDWAREELIKLSTEPAQLINALYLHPQFVEKVTRHDVNRAANEIAEKNNINISSIRIQILENILIKNNNLFSLANKDLIIAKYILKATCPKMGAIYLSRIAFDDDCDFNKCKKLRALQCLMSVIEPETAVKVTNREREALWISLLELLFIVNLEKIDMPFIVSTFMQDKVLAIKQLIEVANGNVEGLKVAAKLAYTYKNEKVIRNLIPLLLHAGLYEEIIPLLLQLFYPPDSVICIAWRAIILNPFQRADYPITERQKANCLTALNLLPVCPVVNDDDLVEIWKNCIRCKCPGLGCLVLPYMTAQKRQTLTELHKIDKRNLIISLKNLHADTYLVSGAMYVLENMSKKITGGR